MSVNLWSAPKTNWLAADGYAHTDANRAENNSEALRDSLTDNVVGFGFQTLNDVTYEGVITTYPGGCITEGGYPMVVSVNWSKNLNTWAAGNGPSFGGVASGATVAAHTWLYVFVLLDPLTGSTEIMLDDNPAGSNVSHVTYTEKRLVNAFKTGAAGTSTYAVVEMYSKDGERVYINPDSLLPSLHWIFFNNASGAGNNNYYNVITLTSATYGPLLPALEVDARLQLQMHQLEDLGLIQVNGGVFTVPTLLSSLGNIVGEWQWKTPGASPYIIHPAQAEILISPAGTVNMAMNHSTAPTGGYVNMVPIGYQWKRVPYGV